MHAPLFDKQPRTYHVAIAGLASVVLHGCSSSSVDLTERQRCVVFEGISKSIPAGGVPVALDVPVSWKRSDGSDGSCWFVPRASSSRVRVALEFCVQITTPCDAKLSRGVLRTTEDTTLLKSTLRRSILKRADPHTHRVVTCSASVQGTMITSALEAELSRISTICDSLVIER